MKSSEKYYWLKLKDDFFSSKRIKKLRKLAGGDTFLIIYLKMQLISMKNDGIIRYTGLEKTFAEELALDIDEDIDNVQVTLSYLVGTGLAESSDNINYFFPYAVENVGSETAAAQRMREARSRVSLPPAEQQENISEQCSNNVRTCYTDIEKEKEIDKELEKEEEVKKRKRFIAPTIEEVFAYCQERKNGVDAQHFVDYYTANGWKVGKNPMKDWRAAVRTWEKNGYNRAGKTTNKLADQLNQQYEELAQWAAQGDD